MKRNFQAQRSRRSNARSRRAPASGQSKKRGFTQRSSLACPRTPARPRSGSGRSGAPASRTVPKPARVRSAARNSSTSISVGEHLLHAAHEAAPGQRVVVGVEERALVGDAGGGRDDAVAERRAAAALVGLGASRRCAPSRNPNRAGPGGEVLARADLRLRRMTADASLLVEDDPVVRDVPGRQPDRRRLRRAARRDAARRRCGCSSTSAPTSRSSTSGCPTARAWT